MTFQIATRDDVLRHTARRVVLASGLAVVSTVVAVLVQMGTDMDATVRVGYVMMSSIGAAGAISIMLTGALTYRSARVTQELTRTAASLRGFPIPIS